MNSEHDKIVEFPHKSDIWGPGMWFNIHTEALAISKQSSYNKVKTMTDNYIEYLNRIFPELPCDTCRNHATTYIKENPLEEYREVRDDDGNYIGIFMWTWIFHNSVSTRLGKPTLSLETSKNIYEDGGICLDDCGN